MNGFNSSEGKSVLIWSLKIVANNPLVSVNSTSRCGSINQNKKAHHELIQSIRTFISPAGRHNQSERVATASRSEQLHCLALAEQRLAQNDQHLRSAVSHPRSVGRISTACYFWRILPGSQNPGASKNTTWGNPLRNVSQGGGVFTPFRAGDEESACCLADSEARNANQFPVRVRQRAGTNHQAEYKRKLNL